MAVATPVDVAVNPNNAAQRYVLWGNGRIDAVGGAVPITNGPRWFDRPDQPVAVALHISDWATGQGQVLDVQGGTHPLNGATDYMTTVDGAPVNTLGIPYVPDRRFCAWSWNPAGTGGYAVDRWGQLYEFGGEVDAPRPGRRFTHPTVRGFVMRWSPDKRAYMVDASGAVWTDFNAVAGTPAAPYWLYADVARDLVITDWDTGAGYVLTADSVAHAFGGAPTGPPGPYRPGGDVARVLHVLSVEDPVILWMVWAGGQSFEHVLSTPPSVVAGGADGPSPAVTVTDTTRPVLAWSYSDPQQDSQAGWELYVFAQTFVDAHGMSDPSVWAADALVAESGINPGTRGVPSPIDLVNGNYRMYVRVKDTAGQWSAWDVHAWTQNVPVPATPTGLSATADDATFSAALSVTATPGSAGYVRFECSDDGEVTWALVRGAERVPLAATVEATDRDAPLGVTRSYRAIGYSTDPRTASEPSESAAATVTRLRYVLRSVDNPTLGGEVPAVDPSEWTRPVTAGVFETLGDEYPTVVKDGNPAKARRLNLHLITHDRAEWEMVKALGESRSTLVYRDPFGEVMYCEIVGNWDRGQLPAAPLAGEDTPLRHMHSTVLPLVEVRPPVLEV